MKRYAILWADGDETTTGRLDVCADRLELRGRDACSTVLYDDITSVTIGRGRRERLRGLPVLVVHRRDRTPIRAASLDGPGVLHELAAELGTLALR